MNNTISTVLLFIFMGWQTSVKPADQHNSGACHPLSGMFMECFFFGGLQKRSAMSSKYKVASVFPAVENIDSIFKPFSVLQKTLSDLSQAMSTFHLPESLWYTHLLVTCNSISFQGFGVQLHASTHGMCLVDTNAVHEDC